ncbi:peptidoglycan-binding domain-containing protein [Kibdelosporangium aridum]|uniref:Putative peptidoglycan binding domain-containing protein n=1 Tax=Kibdelosporangium aridum TaxID=2030 RepID=A0A1Y5Y9Z4_KIBAR|nr:peptidoglycan-binding domain-containing protein [Kibdelosporangium aridum]SMD26449.1 Putative peptidoglycan binding domain-containing protein [Kibdelosporangium aridum]
MRRLMQTLMALAVPAMLITGASPATATAAPAAEVHCTSFSNVNVSWAGPQYFMHVPSTSWDSYNYDCVLARGDRNVAVKALQESLNACYGQGIATDSDFGTATERAVRNAQNEIIRTFGNVLVADGRFGPITSSWFKFQIYDHWNGGTPTGNCAHR